VRATLQPNGDWMLTWNRCSRIGGDVWAPVEPRQEPDGERYRVQVLANGYVVRTVQVRAPSFRYLAADWDAEIPPSAAVKVRVLQLGEGGCLGWETESAISG
jgi:hypothetical protein